MKTPHTIVLSYGESKKYKPETGEYEIVGAVTKTVPCFVNFISKAKLFKEYGTHNEKVAIVRFNQKIRPFNHALFNDDKFIIEDGIDAPIKDSYRIKKVQV